MRRQRRRYYDICLKVVTDLIAERGNHHLEPRVATMSLFGMINWIYTWYRPQSGISVDTLARQMSEIFLTGVTAG